MGIAARDQGSDIAGRKAFSMATDMQMYFCDPASPCSVAPTRTPTACYANIFPGAPT